MSDVDDSIRSDFLAEAGELIERLGTQLVDLEKRPTDQALLNAIFRAFHKGGAGFLGVTPLVELCHAAEDVFNALRNGKRGVDAGLMDAVLAALDHVNVMMAAVAGHKTAAAAPADLIARLHALARGEAAAAAKPARAAAAPATSNTITEDEFDALLDQLAAEKKTAQAPPPAVAAPATPPPAPAPAPAAPVETSVRVDTLKLDRMMNLVGELVLVRNRLKSLHGSGADALGRAVGQLDLITRSLQGAVMQTRMQPIGKVFARFPKLARDTARGLGKQVEVTLEGQETDLDKNLVEALADPLVHMVRNAVDHGIEAPEARLQAGKPAAGRLELSARQAGDHILITVRDDGAGIDPERLRSKALQRGLVDADSAARMSADEALQLVFLPGLSTKEQVSDLSGRGVGMDVVKTAIQQLNGSVHIESKPGSGTVVRIRVPLTLAVLPALMVMVGMRQFALPLAAIDDVFALDPVRVRPLNRWRVLPLRKETLRLVYLQRWLGGDANDAAARHVVVARVNDERYGFVVSQVRAREEVVIKPLGPKLHGLAGVSGATVTPDGRVALILDFAGLVSAYGKALG
jgi:two-component system, chemotaxis family, sensor kinase CheA